MQPMKTYVVRKILRLVTKHGMKFVLQALVEIAENEGSEKFDRLAEDLQKALDRFEKGK